VNTLMKFRVPWNVKNYLTGWGTTSFSKMALCSIQLVNWLLMTRGGSVWTSNKAMGSNGQTNTVSLLCWLCECGQTGDWQMALLVRRPWHVSTFSFGFWTTSYFFAGLYNIYLVTYPDLWV
jgi:hypothetical protein